MTTQRHYKFNKITVTAFRHSHESSTIEAPKKQGDMGCDLRVPTTVVGKVIYPFIPFTIDTLLSIQARDSDDLSYGFVIEPRSSNWKDALLCRGVIDAEYTGTIKVIIRNMSFKPYRIKHGDRLCQLLIHPVPLVDIVYTNEPLIGARGGAGFGSTK